MYRIDNLELAISLIDGILQYDGNLAPVGYGVTAVEDEVVVTRGIMRAYGDGTAVSPPVKMVLQGTDLELSETGHMTGTVTSILLSYLDDPDQSVRLTGLSLSASVISDFTSTRRVDTKDLSFYEKRSIFRDELADAFGRDVFSNPEGEIEFQRYGFHNALGTITFGDADSTLLLPYRSIRSLISELVDGGAGTDTLIFQTHLQVTYSEPAQGFITRLAAAGINTDLEAGTFVGFELFQSNSKLDFYGSPDDDVVMVNDVGVLHGKGGNDSLTGSIHGDFLDGGTGQDTLTGNAGTDLIIGGLGQDIIEGGSGDDILYGDAGAVASDIDILVYRHLRAIYGDEVPEAWYDHWRVALAEGTVGPDDLRAWAAREMVSTNPAFEDPVLFLSEIYRNAVPIYRDLEYGPNGFSLLRGGAGGVDFDGHLGDGNKIEILENFVDYSIFVQDTAIDAVVFHAAHLNGASVLDDVFRLYQAALDRNPDELGFFSWVDTVLAGNTVQDIAAGFTGSREFFNTYGTLDTDGFVTLLYDNVLDRAPDDAGLVYWTTSIEGGAARADILHGFAPSREYEIKSAAAFQEFLAGVNQGDVLAAGEGADLVTGGLGADTFLFRRDQFDATLGAENSVTSITDFEAHDMIHLDGFDGVDAASIFAQSVVQGDDIRITVPSVDIVLIGAATVLSEDHFVFS